jgi:hypothetical protein
MGKKRRYRNKPQKFGRKYEMKYGFTQSEEAVEEPSAPEPEPVVVRAKKSSPAPVKVQLESSVASVDTETNKKPTKSKKKPAAKKKTPASPRKTTAKRTTKAKTTS